MSDLRENLPKTGWLAHGGRAISCVRFGRDQNSVFSLGADGKVRVVVVHLILGHLQSLNFSSPS